MIEEQIQINLEQPIAFGLTNIIANHTEDGFNMFMLSGGIARLYFLSPKLAKKFLLVLQKEIETFETEWGQIQTQLPRPQVSSTSPTPMGFDMSKVVPSSPSVSASASPSA